MAINKMLLCLGTEEFSTLETGESNKDGLMPAAFLGTYTTSHMSGTVLGIILSKQLVHHEIRK
jgi:hypothetical protein